MALLAVLVLTLGLGFWILLPLLRAEDYLASEYPAASELKDLYALKNVAYDTLRDIDFDFRMGKLAEKDYLDLKARYQAEAAEVVGQIETLEERLESERKPRPRGGPVAKPLR